MAACGAPVGRALRPVGRCCAATLFRLVPRHAPRSCRCATARLPVSAGARKAVPRCVRYSLPKVRCTCVRVRLSRTALMAYLPVNRPVTRIVFADTRRPRRATFVASDTLAWLARAVSLPASRLSVPFVAAEILLPDRATPSVVLKTSFLPPRIARTNRCRAAGAVRRVEVGRLPFIRTYRPSRSIKRGVPRGGVVVESLSFCNSTLHSSLFPSQNGGKHEPDNE